MEKIRTIITQDAEVDDQNSLRHLLLYSNDIEIQGIIQTSSIFHWIGQENAKGPKDKPPYNVKYRWTGTEWMDSVIDDYEAVYPHLKIQDISYPTPEYLRSLISVGNIGYPGEMDYSTQGSNLIKQRILDNDSRKLYIQVWGGTNTIARALYDIEKENKDSKEWNNLRTKIEKKVVLTACGEQDDTYRNYISEVYPNIQFVKCLQMRSYGYAWDTMPDSASKDTLRAKFMKDKILSKGALLEKYATWADGQNYQGEPERCQFGTNKDLIENWWGAKAGMGIHTPYDFLSEGDSPTFLCLLPWGLRGLEDFSYGSLSGRFFKDETQTNSKDEILNYWKPVDDEYIGYDGKAVYVESMWKYVDHIQNDFAVRASWCTLNHYGEHEPKINIKENNIISEDDKTLSLCIKHNDNIKYSIKYYKDASDYKENINADYTDGVFNIKLPPNLNDGDQLHFIVKATNKFGNHSTRFQQIIVTIKK